MKRHILLTFAALILGTNGAGASDALQFEPAVVQVRGEILADNTPDSTGALQNATLLILEERTTVSGNPASGNTASRATLMNIRLLKVEEKAPLKLETHYGQVLTLEGSLFNAPDAYHGTQIVLKATKVLGP